MDNQEKNDTYSSIAASSEGVYKEKGSRFLAFAYPVTSEHEVKTLLDKARKDYYDARHHCYAYRIGINGDIWRVNDDGEPSSTAGRPIYSQILSKGLSDILIVVVRYFGGTKLGVPGLIRAYKSAAADAIANSRIVEKTASEMFEAVFDYAATDKVMRALKDMGTAPLSYTVGYECRITARVRLSDTDKFRKRMEEAEARVSRLQDCEA